MARRPQAEVDATRSRILEAAEELFAERGFAAASMSDIAAKAGVTKSLIHHHFDSKQALWDKVRLERYTVYAETQAATLSTDDGGSSFVRKSLTSYFRFLQQNPRFTRILLWSQAEGSNTLHDPSASTRETAQALVQRTAERLKAMQAAGELRSDLDPRMLITCFIGMLRQWFALRGDYYGRVAENGELDDEFLHTALALFWDGARSR